MNYSYESLRLYVRASFFLYRVHFVDFQRVNIVSAHYIREYRN